MKMKKAFTLIELLVVIGIIAILAATLMVSLNGQGDAARAVQCQSNMRNLATACHTYGMARGHFPLAGSIEKVGIDESQGIRNAKMRYSEIPGWLSWNSQNAYDAKPTSKLGNTGWLTSMYSQDMDAYMYAYTNGVLWKYVSGNRAIYTCPMHVLKYKQTPPNWSYVMNSYFGCSSQSMTPKSSAYYGHEYGKVQRLDRRLLFAEIPYLGVEVPPETSEAPGFKCDCTLNYKDHEVIGFNHASGKREKFANVVFADGHSERIRWPRQGISQGQLEELTKWLCEGKDVSFNGKTYEELKN